MDSNHVLIGFVAVVGLRLALRKKLKHQSFNKNSKQKVRLIPSFKNFALMVFCYVIAIYLVVGLFYIMVINNVQKYYDLYLWLEYFWHFYL